MKRTILGGIAVAAVLTSSMMAEARGRGRTVVRGVKARRVVTNRRVTRIRKPVTRRPIARRPIKRRPIIGKRPVTKRPVVKRPIVKRPVKGKRPAIGKRPVIGGKKMVRPIRHKKFFRPKGWAKKFHKHYHLKFGKKFWFGFRYRGFHHRHWSKCVFLPQYGCHGYYCPFTYCYYYWCAPHDCYYPVSYCPTGFYVY